MRPFSEEGNQPWHPERGVKHEQWEKINLDEYKELKHFTIHNKKYFQ
jgi:hypothetical protein